MSRGIRTAFAACILLLALVLAGVAITPSVAGEASPGTAQTRTRGPMTPLVREAQLRCPAGQLVFYTKSCGCNGACCACAAGARFLNHCTCQCSPNPPNNCPTGFSIGNQ